MAPATMAARKVVWLVTAVLVALGSRATRSETPPQLVWRRTLASAADDYVNGMAIDDDGNVVVAGYTAGNLFRNRIGIRDAYVVSYDATGQQRWATQFGAQLRVTDLDDIALGPNGDWYAVGNVDYRRGAESFGGTDVFVQRISSGGTLGFVTQFGTTGSDNAEAITASSTHVFPAGDTYGALAGTNSGGNDAFLARYSVPANLSLVQNWAAQKGTDDWDVVYDAAQAGNRVFVAGETFGNFNGPNIELTDAFLLSFDTDGNFQWARQFGKSNEPEAAYAVTTNGTDAVYIAGFTYLAEHWQSGGDPDAFLAKYDLNGNLQWQRYYQTEVWDVHTALDIDAAGNVYVGGYTGEQSFTPTESDVFIMKYAPNGDLLWHGEYDLAKDERMTGLEVSPSGDRIWMASMTWESDTEPIADGYVALLRQAQDGDFNLDGRVDAADFIHWRADGGTTDQYNLWRANFGSTIPTGSSQGAAAPEPQAVVGLGGAAALAVCRRRRNPATRKG